MKILITGGCGFLGSNLAENVLTQKNYELFILDNLSRQGSSTNLKWLNSKGQFKFYKDDISIYTNIEKIIKDIKPDVIFHLAGQVAMTTSIKYPTLDFNTNTLGSFNILESVKKHSPETIIVYSSTNKVYGDLEWVNYIENNARYIAKDFPKGFSENTPLEFHSPYGCSKGAADQYMLDYYRIFGIRTIVFRHSSMFGGRQFSTYDQGWIGWFCQKAIEAKKGLFSEPFTISGNGKQVRDVLHAADMINLYFSAIKNINETKGQAFNIGGGIDNSLSLLELFDILEKKLDVKLRYNKLNPRESDQKVFVADITKAKKLMNWDITIDKETGISRMLEWVENNE